MANAPEKNDNHLPLPVIRQATTPSVADQIFDALSQRILSLKLPPGTKISEAEVAKQMGVSRQPVREAFKRLAKLGFLFIRPQSSTTVSLISESAVLRARFIRTALEVKTSRTAAETLGPEGLAELAALIEEQKDAISAKDRDRFHALDDAFHREICEQSGVGYVWNLIHENKAHMDRVRMLTLDSASQKLALDDHIKIFNAIRSNDTDAVEREMTEHLARILIQIEAIKADKHNWFTENTP
ncbi:GntR family transcriptional regulator [Shimia sp.]|uniref:GntR family transcriptional regulator n=1 Tax=Shimia sp. TaxID=1954381 RepID=UPI0031071520